VVRVVMVARVVLVEPRREEASEYRRREARSWKKVFHCSPFGGGLGFEVGSADADLVVVVAGAEDAEDAEEVVVAEVEA
jgi:hypothetical protein